jgi:hypothetical protein
MSKTHTTVDFTAEGATVDDLLNNAVDIATRVAGEHDWTLEWSGRVYEAESMDEWGVQAPKTHIITRWKQEYQIKVDL